MHVILWRTVFISAEFEVADHSPCLRYICGQRSRVLISATYLEAEQSAPLHCMCPSGEEHSSPLHLWKQSTALLSAASMEAEYGTLHYMWSGALCPAILVSGCVGAEQCLS